LHELGPAVEDRAERPPHVAWSGATQGNPAPPRPRAAPSTQRVSRCSHSHECPRFANFPAKKPGPSSSARRRSGALAGAAAAPLEARCRTAFSSLYHTNLLDPAQVSSPQHGSARRQHVPAARRAALETCAGLILLSTLTRGSEPLGMSRSARIDRRARRARARCAAARAQRVGESSRRRAQRFAESLQQREQCAAAGVRLQQLDQLPRAGLKCPRARSTLSFEDLGEASRCAERSARGARRRRGLER
jgi:hypothetical protein